MRELEGTSGVMNSSSLLYKTGEGSPEGPVPSQVLAFRPLICRPVSEMLRQANPQAVA